jgi:hypothetical protein
VRERVLEATPRLDRRADDDELGAALIRHARDLLAQQAGARADDLAPGADAVRSRDGRGQVEPVAQRAQLVVEPRVERQLPLDEERCNENDPRAAVSGEPAGEIERVLRLLPLEQRHDNRPVADRARAARQPPSVVMEPAEVGTSHRTSG